MYWGPSSSNEVVELTFKELMKTWIPATSVCCRSIRLFKNAGPSLSELSAWATEHLKTLSNMADI